VNADERPTFTMLVGEFEKMFYEPRRYLHVPVCAIDPKELFVQCSHNVCGTVSALMLIETYSYFTHGHIHAIEQHKMS